jgi:hypothetical protein
MQQLLQPRQILLQWLGLQEQECQVAACSSTGGLLRMLQL